MKVTGLLIALCALAGAFYIAKSGNVFDYTLEVPASILAHESLSNGQENVNGVADHTVTSDFPLAALFDSLNLNDPYIDQQWALNRIQAPELWQVNGGNANIIVAILDTGIDKDHEDLAGAIVAEVNFAESPMLDDINGHGTHIAGIIAATNNNGKGIAGLAPGVCLMNVKVADDIGRCQAADLARGIFWAVENGADVINISLELAEPSGDVARAIEYAWSRGALVIAAAGNNGSNIAVYPAGYENTIAVAALTMDDELAPLSNYGEWVDVAAPGMNIYSLLPANNYGYKTGTSFAAAHVSGVAAVLFSIASDTNGNGFVNDEVGDAIKGSCDKIGAGGVGSGKINAAGALAKIR